MLGVYFLLGLRKVYLEFIGLVLVCSDGVGWVFDIELVKWNEDLVVVSLVFCDNLFLVVVVMFNGSLVWVFFILRDFNWMNSVRSNSYGFWWNFCYV